MINKNLASRYNLDIPLLAAVFLLVIIGIVFLYSAGSYTDSKTFLQPFMKQLLFLLPGGLVFTFFMLINYQKLSGYYIVFYIVSLGLLALVLIIGKDTKGATSWFSFGGQPSELTKIFFIFVLAQFVTRFRKKLQTIPYFLLTITIPLPIIGLIMLQPDLGTALVYIPITAFIMFAGGAKIKHLLVISSIGFIVLSIGLFSNYHIKGNSELIKKDQIDRMVKKSILFKTIFTKQEIVELKKLKITSLSDATIARNELKKKIKKIKWLLVLFTLKIAIPAICLAFLGFLFWKWFRSELFKTISLVGMVLTVGLLGSILPQMMLKPYQTARIFSFVDLNKDPRGSSYNQRQSIFAIGSGGLTGQGWLEGAQNRLNYIPEKTTDFIFAVIGEEWGFFRGTVLILMLYGIVIYRGLLIAYNSKDYFGTLIATGITAMFFFHIVVNLGMCIGILPVMGIPLPFLSAGGSSLITGLISIALLLNISQRKYVN